MNKETFPGLDLRVIDKKDNKYLSVELIDEDNNTIDIEETVKELLDYALEGMASQEDNVILFKILPLVMQSLPRILYDSYNREAVTTLLANQMIRTCLVNSMIVSFLLYKTIKDNNYKIATIEEQVDREEMETFSRRATITELISTQLAYGVSPKETLDILLENNEITQEDYDLFTLKDDED